MKFRKLLTGITILFVLLFIASTLGQMYAEHKYSGQVLHVRDDFGIVIDKFDVQLWRGRIVLTDISVPDSLSGELNFGVGSIQVSGIRWLKLIQDRKLAIKNVEVFDLSAKGNISGFFSDSTKRDKPRIVVAEISHLGLEFDPEMNPRVTFVETGNVSYDSGGNYSFELRGIRSPDPEKVIHLDSLIMKPRYPKFEFGNRTGRREGRVDLVVPEVRIHEFDLKRLTRDSVIDIRSIDIIAGTVNIFTDKRLPVDEERYVAMPHELLLNSSQDVWIDSVNVRDLHMRYETINPNTMNQGFIEFKNSYLTLANVTNVPDAISENHVMRLDIFSKFMGDADLNAHFNFLLNRRDYKFSWTGRLEQMEINEIDKFTIPVANMNIVEGSCQSVEFQVVADIDSSHGTIDFSYENLKIMAINPETHRYRKLISGVANMFFVKADNVKGSDDYRVGQIAYAHETNRGLEHYVWTSLEKGLMYTILPDGIARRMEPKGESPNSEIGKDDLKGKKRKRKR